MNMKTEEAAARSLPSMIQQVKVVAEKELYDGCVVDKQM